MTNLIVKRSGDVLYLLKSLESNNWFRKNSSISCDHYIQFEELFAEHYFTENKVCCGTTTSYKFNEQSSIASSESSSKKNDPRFEILFLKDFASYPLSYCSLPPSDLEKPAKPQIPSSNHPACDLGTGIGMRSSQPMA